MVIYSAHEHIFASLSIQLSFTGQLDTQTHLVLSISIFQQRIGLCLKLYEEILTGGLLTAHFL